MRPGSVLGRVWSAVRESLEQRWGEGSRAGAYREPRQTAPGGRCQLPASREQRKYLWIWNGEHGPGGEAGATVVLTLPRVMDPLEELRKAGTPPQKNVSHAEVSFRFWVCSLKLPNLRARCHVSLEGMGSSTSFLRSQAQWGPKAVRHAPGPGSWCPSLAPSQTSKGHTRVDLHMGCGLIGDTGLHPPLHLVQQEIVLELHSPPPCLARLHLF